jgi:addiction module HigA family antidote
MAVTAIHPGEHLSEEVQTLGMSAAELGRNLDVPTNRITQIVNGQRAITGDTALRLGHFFGTSPEFWLNLQTLYELRVAQLEAGSAIQALPTLKSSAPMPRKKQNLQKLVNAVRPGNRRGEAEFGSAHGKEVSRGARRTR